MELKAQLGNKAGLSVIAVGRFLKIVGLLSLVGITGYALVHYKLMEQTLLNFKGNRVKGTINMVDPLNPQKLIYAYRVNGKTYMASVAGLVRNEPGDTIEVLYYPTDPSVSRVNQ